MVTLCAAWAVAAHAEPAAETLAAAQRGDGGARASLESAATAGDAAAARVLGDLAWHGVGEPADPARGIHWWQRAADAGDTTARYDLGLLAAQAGEFGRAEPLLLAAAEAGHVLAAYALGTARATRQDDVGAIPWLERAAQAGYAPAQFNLAAVLARAPGDPARRADARRWYAAAAERFPPARDALAALDASAATGESPTPKAGTDTAQVADTAVAASAPTTRKPEAPHASTAPPATVLGPAWLREQASQHYTIQIAAGSDDAPLAALLAAHPTDVPVALLRLRTRGAHSVVAVVGSFGDRAEAERAAVALPAGLRVSTPWIRRIEGLKRDLAEQVVTRGE